MTDFGLLVRLRLRHAYSRITWWAGTAGADLRSGSLADRAYAGYLGILLGGWMYLMLAAAIDLTHEAAMAAGIAQSATVLLPWTPALLLVAYSASALRETPIKLGFADMACVAATPVSRAAIVGAWFVTGAPGGALGGALAGLLGGVAASGAADPVNAARLAVPIAVAMGVAAVLARALGWAVGLARLGGIDMTRITDASVAYAQYEVFRPLALYDASAAADLRRRIRLAARAPRGAMPRWIGPGALVARSLTTHVRQPHTLVGPLVLGGLVAPAGLALLATGQRLVAYLPWLFVIVALDRYGMAKVHRASSERPWLHNLLPYGELTRMALHSLPALTLGTAASVGTAAPLIAATGAAPTLIALAPSLVVSLTLCQALGTIVVPPMRRPIDYPASALVSAAAIMGTAHAEGARAALGVAALCVLLLSLGIRAGDA